jgi:predicted dehydrogenase
VTFKRTTSRSLRVALVGCGKVADQHVEAIHRIPDCVIVGLCDRELLMAKQLGERTEVTACFSDLQEMLRTTKPDVVHITTPPQSHLPLARECLEFGSHVYLEKPFTITAHEAETLIELAENGGLKITVGHNYLFTLEMLEMRRLVRDGFLGGRPIHLESYWSYDLGDRSYVAPMLGNRNHWVRQLPGQLFHNIISHGIAKLAEFVDDELTEIAASAHQSEQLRSLGADEVIDELRVLIRDKNGTGTLVRSRTRSYKSYLTYFVPPLKNAAEYFRNGLRNIASFMRRHLYQDFGMKELIERFYDSIRLGKSAPIPYREIILTTRIMDEIFAQIYPNRTREDGRQTTGSETRGQKAVLGPQSSFV